MIGNLLGLAQSVVGVQPVTLAKFTGRVENAAGYQVPSYAAPVPIKATVQPIPQAKYQALGLDWNHEYVTLFTPAGVVTVGRDASGDKVTFAGGSYLCESATPWSAQAGWSSIVAVKVPA